MKTKADWISCGKCNRGGNGNDKDKCSFGWTVIDPNSLLGCFLGTSIEGQIVPKKLTRSQENYQRFLRSDTGLSFAEWMGFGK